MGLGVGLRVGLGVGAAVGAAVGAGEPEGARATDGEGSPGAVEASMSVDASTSVSNSVITTATAADDSRPSDDGRGPLLKAGTTVVTTRTATIAPRRTVAESRHSR